MHTNISKHGQRNTEYCLSQVLPPIRRTYGSQAKCRITAFDSWIDFIQIVCSIWVKSVVIYRYSKSLILVSVYQYISVHLYSHTLDYGRKLEHPEESHANTGRRHRLSHTPTAVRKTLTYTPPWNSNFLWKINNYLCTCKTFLSHFNPLVPFYLQAECYTF